LKRGYSAGFRQKSVRIRAQKNCENFPRGVYSTRLSCDEFENKTSKVMIEYDNNFCLNLCLSSLDKFIDGRLLITNKKWLCIFTTIGIIHS